MISELKEKIVSLPARPGVYLMKDAAGKYLYVGKAANLKKRVAAYLKPAERLDPKTRVLVGKIAGIETILCGSEKEALILESNLIKKHRPRYNVVLKDDKRYPSLRLDPRQRYPNLTIARKIEKDGALYFGPYASAHAVRQTLRFIDKHFRLRKCRNREFRQRTRPCLHCQMQRCLAPCCMDVPPETYAEGVKEVVLFLKGRTPELIRKLEARMRKEAEQQRFERAAGLRDKIVALKKTLEKQVAVTTDFKDRDVVAVARRDNAALVALIPVRGGFMSEAREFFVPDSLSAEEELVDAFVRQYYEEAPFIPGEILVQTALENRRVLEERLGEIKGGRTRILNPKRGEKASLMALGIQNAEERLQERQKAADQDRKLLERLQRRLGLPRPPLHVECFDNANLFGQAPVAGMAVFRQGRPDSSSYRRYRIRSVQGPDDYASMAEVLRRRYGGLCSGESLPDLLLVDGGKGQLNIARQVMEALGLSDRIPMAAIAKKDPARGDAQDKIYLPGRRDPVSFGKEPELLLFLQRVRDEAHRLAVSFHRRRHRKESVASVLDNVSGIGEKRKQALWRHFGGTEAMARASIEEIAAVPGMTRPAARAVKAHLNEQAEKGSDHDPPDRPGKLVVTK